MARTVLKTWILSKYYLATPAFMLVEWLAGLNLRVSIPWGGDLLTYLYMAACFVLGGFILKKPSYLNLFALIESSVNLFLLVLSVYLPIIAVTGGPGEAGTFTFGIAELIHFVIVGSILLYVFYSNPLMKNNV